MADVVTRLVVESKEYDSKISRATAGLTQFEKKCREAGGTLEHVEKEDLAFVKSLGQMETVSTTATGKLSEMKKAFTELSVQYKNLTDAEKKSPYGKALAGSLDQLKGRIGDLSGQIGEAGKELQGSKGFVDGFSDALGQLGPVGQTAGKLLKGAFGPVGIAIAAVLGIIKQVIDAFKRNEDAMASAARAAAPFKAIWQQIQRLFDKLVPLIADGIEKIADSVQSLFQKLTDWTGKLANTKLGKKLGLESIYIQLKGLAAEQDELTASNKRIADSERELQTLRRNATVDNAQAEKEIARLREQASEKDKYTAEERVQFLEQAAKLEEQTLKRNLEIKQKELDLIRLKNSLTSSGTEDLDAEAEAEAALLQAQTNYYNSMRTLQRQIQSARNEGQGDDEGQAPIDIPVRFVIPEGSAAALQAKIKDLQEQWNNATSQADRDALAAQIEEANKALGEMKGKVEKVGEAVSKARDSFKDLKSGVSSANELVGAINSLKSVGDDLASVFSGEKDAWESLMTVFQSGISVMQTLIGLTETINTLKELGIGISKVQTATAEEEAAASAAGAATTVTAEGMKAAASGTTAAVNAAEAATEAGSAVADIPIVGPVLAVAAIAAVLGATIAAMSKAKNAGNFAIGGVVGGNSFSGDNMIAHVNSGETILTAAQTGRVESMLSNNPMQNLQLSTQVSGADLRIVLNNDNRSRGGSRGYYSNIK